MSLVALVATVAFTPLPNARAQDSSSFESTFDRTLGTQLRAPRMPSSFEAQIAALANGAQGRIGVAALDLNTNRSVAILGEQPFPMASTSKIAIVATFLDGVDRGKFRLTDQFPLLVPVPSPKLAGSVAPVRPGAMLSALTLIEMAITRSNNEATDALLAVVGGPRAVNAWLRRAGIDTLRLDRDIATLVRDDGIVDPARTVDQRDSATPLGMVRLLSGLHRGEWLSRSSRDVLLGAMSRCRTGKHRIPGMMPEGARIAHKTGTLHNTSSDVGFVETPDGHTVAVAIYVTGQGGKPQRDSRIATIARALYDGYEVERSSGARLAASR